VVAQPQAKVAAHRSKPAFSLAGLMTVWPIIQWAGDKELSPEALLILVVAGCFALGHWLIFLFFRSV
tara:strand:+ start:16235 stop:16435 length:201 start_codon:yes stop_codon:yes gene_type:complete